MSKAWMIATANLKRFLRDRSNIFFVFIFPLGLVFILGLSFGGTSAERLGVVADEDPLAQRLIAALESEHSIEVVRESQESELRNRVERGALSGGLLVPPDMSAQLARAGVVRLQFLTTSDGVGGQLRLPVMAAVSEVAEPVRAALLVNGRVARDDASVGAAGAGLAGTLELVSQVAQEAQPIEVRREMLGESSFGDDIDPFDLGAASQLVLFMFLTGLTGSAALIKSRQLGVSRRMLATPTSTLTIVTGEALGRFAVALFQGLYIMLATWLLFAVNWGDLFGAAALLIVFAAVAAGAGMLMGSIFENDQQAGGVAVMVGLGLAALGGAMVPLEIFGPTMQVLARFTPHAWAVDGFGVLLRHGGTFWNVLPQLTVLAAFAIGLMLLASWQLRRTLLRGAG